MQTTTTTTPTERRRTTNTTCRSPAQQIHNGPSHVHLVAAVSPALVVGGVAVGAAVGAGALPTLLRPAKKARARAAAAAHHHLGVTHGALVGIHVRGEVGCHVGGHG